MILYLKYTTNESVPPGITDTNGESYQQVCAEVLTVNIVITVNVGLYPAEISPLIEQAYIHIIFSCCSATGFHRVLDPTLMQILFKRFQKHYNHICAPVFALEMILSIK